MQLCLQCSCGRRLHRSSGLQKAQAIRMTPRWIPSKAKGVPLAITDHASVKEIGVNHLYSTG